MRNVPSRPAIAWCNMYTLYTIALCQFPCDGMFPSAISYKEHSQSRCGHRAKPRRVEQKILDLRGRNSRCEMRDARCAVARAEPQFGRATSSFASHVTVCVRGHQQRAQEPYTCLPGDTQTQTHLPPHPASTTTSLGPNTHPTTAIYKQTSGRSIRRGIDFLAARAASCGRASQAPGFRRLSHAHAPRNSG